MLEIIALFSVAVLLGGMTAFSFLFAPLVFMKLPSETAGSFIRAVFPWYYLFIFVLAAIGGAALVVKDATLAIVMLIVAVGGVVAREVLMPAINECRDASLAGDQKAEKRFNLLHRTSVAINMAQLLAAGGILTTFAL